MKSTDELLDHFGYTEDWLRLGVVTRSSLQNQLTDFEQSHDQNKEHYRNGAFRAFLGRLDSVSDGLLSDLLLLKDSGSDGCDLALNRALDLVRSQLLTESQLQVLAMHPEYGQQSSFITTVQRSRVLCRLTTDGLTDQLFLDATKLNDATVLLALLDRDDLCRDHLVWIAEHGCNRHLRNVSKQMLESRLFPEDG